MIGVVLSICCPALHGIEGLPIISNIQSGITAMIGALVGAGLVYWIAVLGEVIFRKPAMGECRAPMAVQLRNPSIVAGAGIALFLSLSLALCVCKYTKTYIYI